MQKILSQIRFGWCQSKYAVECISLRVKKIIAMVTGSCGTNKELVERFIVQHDVILVKKVDTVTNMA